MERVWFRKVCYLGRAFYSRLQIEKERRKIEKNVRTDEKSDEETLLVRDTNETNLNRINFILFDRLLTMEGWENCENFSAILDQN